MFSLKTYFLQIIVCLALVLHVACTVMYLSPKNLFKQKLNAFVSNYMFDFFYQDWHLFSPTPGIDTLKLWIKCETDSGTSQWFDPMERVLRDHYSNRFNGKGKLLYVYNGIASGLMAEVEKRRISCAKIGGSDCTEDAILREVKATAQFSLARRYSDEICRMKTSGRLMAGSQIKLMQFSPKKFSERHMQKKWGSVTEIEFGFVAAGQI